MAGTGELTLPQTVNQILTNEELAAKDEFVVMRGIDFLNDRNGVELLERAWQLAYRNSAEPAQSENPLYKEDDNSARAKRIVAITKELSQPSAIIAYKSENGTINAFFWGLSVIDLIVADNHKATQVIQEISNSSKVEFKIEWDQAVYLSMLGVVPGTIEKGLGIKLTIELIKQFNKKKFNNKKLNYFVLRTINKIAKEKIYDRLGFITAGEVTEKIKNVDSNQENEVTRYLFAGRIEQLNLENPAQTR